MKRIGLFGGAFSPPHIEHLRIADAAKKELSLDKVVFIPSFNAPHKSTSVSFELRVEMLKGLIKGREDDFFVSEVEKELKGKTYTVALLTHLKREFPDNEYFLIIGGDSFKLINSWYNYENLISIPIYVVPRGDERVCLQALADEFNKDGWKVTISGYTGDAKVSSAIVRAQIELLGKSPYLSDETVQIIVSNGLYSVHRAYVEKFVSTHSERLIQHSFNTVLTALYLARNYYIDYSKVFLAALLHDNMKERAYVYPEVPPDSIGTAVLHAFNGAYSLAPEYGITDEEIFSAVYYHTTGKADMTVLEKIIYLADMLEPNRDFPGVDTLRQETDKNLNRGFALAIKRSYEYLVSRNVNIYYLTVECYEYYKRSIYDE